jgi:hypothetical protein
LQVRDGSIYLHDSIIERTTSTALLVEHNGRVELHNCSGGQSGGNYTTLANLGNGIRTATGGIVQAAVAYPTGETANTSRGVGSMLNVESGAVATASSGTPTVPTTTTIKYVDDAVYRATVNGTSMGNATSGWGASTPHGGYRSSTGERKSGFWRLRRDGGAVQNLLTGLASKTILSAYLTIYSGTAGAEAITRNLYYLKTSGNPSGINSPDTYLTDTGVNVTIERGENTVINLKTWLQAMVNAGTAFYGFGVGVDGVYNYFSSLCDFEITYQ